MAWIDPNFPKMATPSDLVGRVLGLNPGMMTASGTNTYLVGRRDPVLIDTGAGIPEYVPLFGEYLDHRGWARPSRIILTHRHRDHLGGVAHLREKFPGLSVAKMIWKDTDLPEGTEDLRDGQVVTGDGVTLVPVHTPGHASDHLCYYLPEERALFSGDLILNGSTSVIPEEDGDLGLYLDSLRRVQALDLRRIYPAHGEVIEDAAGKIQEYIDHRMLREKQILETLGGGATTIPAIVKIIYAEVPEKLHAMAGQSVHSHLKKLLKDGRVSEETIPNAPSRWTLLG
ncbi:MAG TPA: MBL fold metallo-hydrolase [Candidatus Limnocylindrales bacterium]|nr:MBL fold metallo-hydrolase [Candidatus Limnocylindrales bacterium]